MHANDYLFKPCFIRVEHDSVVSQLCNHHKVGKLLPNACPPCAKSPRGGIRHHLNTLRHLTRQKLHRGTGFGVQNPSAQSWMLKANDSSWCRVRRGSYPPTKPMHHLTEARPYPLPQCKPMTGCQVCCSTPMSQCRVCYSNMLWEQSSNRSAPSVCSSVLIGKERSGPCFPMSTSLNCFYFNL